MVKDYRLKENRMEVFKDFYWFHQKYRIHPGLVYLYLPEMVKGMTKEQKYWVAFLEGCTQNPNTVWAIIQFFPNRPYTAEEMKEFEEFHDYVYAKLDYDTDRIRQKGKLVKQLEEYNRVVGPSSEAMFEGKLFDQDKKKWFTNVFEFILKDVWGFGRMSAWSYTEFIKIAVGLDYEFDKYYMTEHDSSMSMRNGLLLLYGFDEMHIWKELPNNPKTHSKELMEWAEEEVKELEKYLKTQYTDITPTAETIESILCAFKNMIRGRRYPNIYTDMSYDRIKKAEELWGDKVDFSLFWETRKKYLPKELLFEEGYGNYLTDNSDKAVNKQKQMYFRETGVPLFLDLEFSKYSNKQEELVIGGSNTSDVEIKDEEHEDVIEETTQITVKDNANIVPTIDLKTFAGRFDEYEEFTKEELKEIRKNKTTKQPLVGNTIFPEIGFNTKWEDYIYALTPIELRTENGVSMHFKRDDYFAPLGYGGINGSKLRQALYLATKQIAGKDWDVILTGATSISPQLPMTCAIAKYYNLPSMGLTSAHTSDMLEISRGFGGNFKKTKVAYNVYVQQKLEEMKKNLEDQGYKPFTYHYGLTIDLDNSPVEDVKEFYGVGANQVRSLIGTNIEDLIIALGSANSATAVMYGLMLYHKELPIKDLHLIGVGPNTYERLITRLELLASYDNIDLNTIFNFDSTKRVEGLINIHHYDPHTKKLWEYTTRIYESFAGIDMHYTYEGKMLRFMRIFLPHLFKETSCFWIIGSGLDKKRLEPYYHAPALVEPEMYE